MRGKNGELICHPGDHSVCEEDETAMDYDKISFKDRQLGIGKETCLLCRREMRGQTARPAQT